MDAVLFLQDLIEEIVGSDLLEMARDNGIRLR